MTAQNAATLRQEQQAIEDRKRDEAEEAREQAMQMSARRAEETATAREEHAEKCEAWELEHGRLEYELACAEHVLERIDPDIDCSNPKAAKRSAERQAALVGAERVVAYARQRIADHDQTRP
ncbi:MAG TPA: hypothetical protein VGH09_12475 [Solirubrobacteraceae bacterium]